MFVHFIHICSFDAYGQLNYIDSENILVFLPSNKLFRKPCFKNIFRQKSFSSYVCTGCFDLFRTNPAVVVERSTDSFAVLPQVNACLFRNFPSPLPKRKSNNSRQRKYSRLRPKKEMSMSIPMPNLPRKRECPWMITAVNIRAVWIKR